MNNIHIPVGVSQVSQLVVMILLINDSSVPSLVVIISRMNFVLYRNRHILSKKDRKHQFIQEIVLLELKPWQKARATVNFV